MATKITNATWANFFWPMSANGANPYGIIGGDSREYPVSTSGIPEYFTATDGSLLHSDVGPTAELAANFFFIGKTLIGIGSNNLPDFYLPQVIGQSVTTDTISFTISSDAYTTGQDLGTTLVAYVVTIGNMTEVA